MSGLSTPIQLIVGLGNPGNHYAQTRHNAGAWLVEKLAADHHINLRLENKFHGFHATLTIENQRCHLLIPHTFMNHSGQAIRALATFYDIPSSAIVVAHDELDLAVGDIRLKFSGGHGGHNGLRDTIAQLHTHDFYRLRIGIGHPGQRHLVTDYVLSAPSRSEKILIDESLERAIMVLPHLLQGTNQKAMQVLHTK